MPYPDNFSAHRYDETVGGTWFPEPPLYAATPADIAALTAIRAASAVFLAELRRHPWTFDSTETVSWADHVAEHAAIDAAIGAALDEARRSLEAAL